ncbi:hypothetical protein X798_02299 [Onchocerca flexuosa]|uniref:Adenosine kinase n=1 Tax=Onchocerca flexuosa TaxID=387005 RepID=A0A238C0M1_9BILA|nr:hypothetical protein X798_02299 [Onchocerca flexuosa]
MLPEEMKGRNLYPDLGEKNSIIDTANNAMYEEMKCIKYALKLQHFQRMVILTQGPDPAILYENGNGEVVGYPVTKLKYEEIDDSNETDYAFVGALLSQYIQKKSITESIKCGFYATVAVIRQYTQKMLQKNVKR